MKMSKANTDKSPIAKLTSIKNSIQYSLRKESTLIDSVITQPYTFIHHNKPGINIYNQFASES